MILSLDIGSSYVKMALFRSPSDPLSKITSPHRHSQVLAYQRFPLPLYQQNALSISAIAQQFPALFDKLGQQDFKLEALAISSHNPCLLAMDYKGRQVGAVIHRIDPRLKELSDNQAYFQPLARLLWQSLSEEEKQDLAQILTPSSYLAYTLGAAPDLIPVPLHLKQLFWTEPQAESKFCECDKKYYPYLPELVELEKAVGHLNYEKMRALGLGHYLRQASEVQKIPIYCIGVDFFASELGIPQVAQQMLHNRTGTSEGYNLVLSQAQAKALVQDNLPPAYFVNRHVIKGNWMLSSVEEGVGRCFQRYFLHWQGEDLQSSEEFLQKQEKLRSSGFEENFDFRGQEALILEFLESQLQKDFLRYYKKASAAESQRISPELFALLGKYQDEVFVKLNELISDLDSFRDSDLKLQGMLLIMSMVFQKRCKLLESLVPSPDGQPRSVVISGGQGYYSSWLEFKARSSGYTIERPSLVETELLGLCAFCLWQLGHSASMEAASKSLWQIVERYPGG